MDFGCELERTRGVVSRSGIRIVDETHFGEDEIDRKLCRAANEAAKDLFLGNENPSKPPRMLYDGADSPEEGCSKNKKARARSDSGSAKELEQQVTRYNEQCKRIEAKLPLIDCKHFDEHHLPAGRELIKEGDLVVVFESFNDLNFVYAKKDAIFSNRNGHFKHNSFIGKPYGCKIRSNNNSGLGFLYLLRPTPELWARSLPHRTQIVHELDASMIVHYLNLCPNMTVCESGTGSGAMSHAIMRSIAPRGMLHTFEFNKVRADKAKKEFQEHGLGHLVQVHHRDVCGKKSLLLQKSGEKPDGADEEPKAGDDGPKDYENDVVDEDDGTGGFLIGQAKAHAIFLDLPEPWLAVPHAAHTLCPNGRICSYSPCMEQTQRTCAALRRHGFHSLRTVEARLKEFYVATVELPVPPTDLPVVLSEEASSIEKVRLANGGVLTQDQLQERAELLGQKRKGDELEKEPEPKRLLCARPFAQMRGHSAFLTFATSGNTLRPDPTKNNG